MTDERDYDAKERNELERDRMADDKVMMELEVRLSKRFYFCPCCASETEQTKTIFNDKLAWWCTRCSETIEVL